MINFWSVTGLLGGHVPYREEEGGKEKIIWNRTCNTKWRILVVKKELIQGANEALATKKLFLLPKYFQQDKYLYYEARRKNVLYPGRISSTSTLNLINAFLLSFGVTRLVIRHLIYAIALADMYEMVRLTFVLDKSYVKSRPSCIWTDAYAR